MIVAIAGLATVQDRGRPGRMHEGVPVGGACVPRALALANARAGNRPDAAAIELFGTMTLTAHAPVVVATDGPLEASTLGAGERWTVACGPRRVTYLAFRGGIDVPFVLGGRGTLLVAGLGGHEGRPLRKGDGLRVATAGAGAGADADAGADAFAGATEAAAVIRVIAGPDLERFHPDALPTLLAATFTISPRSDRVGVRLEGPPLRRLSDDRAVSGPMVRGAIQVPASGQPIVLGPDHPTTGGYPVLATIIRTDQGAVMARPVGARLSFSR